MKPSGVVKPVHIEAAMSPVQKRRVTHSITRLRIVSGGSSSCRGMNMMSYMTSRREAASQTPRFTEFGLTIMYMQGPAALWMDWSTSSSSSSCSVFVWAMSISIWSSWPKTLCLPILAARCFVCLDQLGRTSNLMTPSSCGEICTDLSPPS